MSVTFFLVNTLSLRLAMILLPRLVRYDSDWYIPIRTTIMIVTILNYFLVLLLVLVLVLLLLVLLLLVLLLLVFVLVLVLLVLLLLTIASSSIRLKFSRFRLLKRYLEPIIILVCFTRICCYYYAWIAEIILNQQSSSSTN
jgi:hypothetical protein